MKIRLIVQIKDYKVLELQKQSDIEFDYFINLEQILSNWSNWLNNSK